MNETPRLIVPVTYTPVAGLSELRGRHSALLQRQESKERQIRLSPEEILGFLETARCLGRMLSDFDQRETAQGIMDYWTAKLLSQVPQASDSLQSFYLDDFDESTAGHVRTDAEVAAQQTTAAATKGDEILETAPPIDRDILRQLLLRFFRLKENSIDIYSVPLLASDPILKNPDARRLLEQLVTAGLVRRLSVGTDSASHELANPRLLIEWGGLKQLTTRRRGFRELARGWDKGGRQTAALLNGGISLRNAESYSDLDDIEADFLAGSRRQKETHWKIVAVVVFAVVLVIAAILAIGYARLKVERDNAVNAKAQLQAERDKAEAAANDLKIALTQTELALKSANELRRIQMTNTNIATNAEENRKRMETIKRATESLDGVSSNLNSQFMIKYGRKF